MPEERMGVLIRSPDSCLRCSVRESPTNRTDARQMLQPQTTLIPYGAHLLGIRFVYLALLAFPRTMEILSTRPAVFSIGSTLNGCIATMLTRSQCRAAGISTTRSSRLSSFSSIHQSIIPTPAATQRAAVQQSLDLRVPDPQHT